MKAELLLNHFNRISDAHDAVPRMRRFILDFAVIGKLSEQKSEDQPTRELLELQGGVRQNDIQNLPNGWFKAKVGQLLNFQYGKGLPGDARTEAGRVPVFGSNGIVGFTSESLTEQPAIIIGRKGSAGALNLCNGPSWTTDVAYFVQPPPFFDIRFLLIALKTLNLDQLGKGVKPGLSRNDAYDLDLVVPPPAEQYRIVVKVDQLMALCDELQSRDDERERRRTRLTTAIAHHLTNGAAPEAFREHARFYISHASDLTLRPEQVPILRQTILNLAVRGQLLPQDSRDGPVSELLKSIAAENSKLQAAKGIRPQKSVAPAPSFESETLIPRTWVHAYLQDLAYQITDGTHLTPTYTHKGQPFLSAQNVKPFRFMPENHRFVSDADFAKYRSNRRPELGDVLLTRVGAGIGEAAVLDLDLEFAFYVSLCLIKIPTRFVNPHYLVLWLNSPEGRHSSRVRTYGKSASQGNLNLGLIRTFKIPLPPLAEQNRIVAKVAELMTICDRLEEQLRVTQTEKSRLLESVLHCTVRGVSELKSATTKDDSLPTIAAEVCSL